MVDRCLFRDHRCARTAGKIGESLHVSGWRGRCIGGENEAESACKMGSENDSHAICFPGDQRERESRFELYHEDRRSSPSMRKFGKSQGPSSFRRREKGGTPRPS